MMHTEGRSDRLQKIEWRKLHSCSLPQLFEQSKAYRQKFNLPKLLNRPPSESSTVDQNEECGLQILSLVLIASSLPLQKVEPLNIPFQIMTDEQLDEYKKTQATSGLTVMIHSLSETGESQVLVDPVYLERYFNELKRINLGIHSTRDYYATVGDFLASIAHEMDHERHARQSILFHLDDEQDESSEKNASGFEARFLLELALYFEQHMNEVKSEEEQKILTIIRESCLVAREGYLQKHAAMKQTREMQEQSSPIQSSNENLFGRVTAILQKFLRQ